MSLIIKENISEDEELLKELFSSSSEEEEEEEESKINKKIISLGEYEENHFFPDPDENDPQAVLLYAFFYGIHYVIFCHKSEVLPEKPDPVKDSREVFCEKSYMVNCCFYYQKFQHLISEIAETVYKNVESLIEKRVKEHPLLFFIQQLPRYKELHSRRIKSDPVAPRTKSNEIIKTYNAVTFEEFEPENRIHKTWHCLILNPLPSDFDQDEFDGQEGGEKNAVIQEVSKLTGEIVIPEPFSITVDFDWDKLIRTLHILLHFEDYMQTYIVSSISENDFNHIQSLSRWKDIWTYLVGDAFANLRIEKFARIKKTIPEIVSRIAELRDILKESINLVKIKK